MSNQRITGQLIIRDTDATEVAGPGRKLVMVFGVLAVPEDLPLQGEHQYVTVGGVIETLGVRITILPQYGLDLTKIPDFPVDGWRPDQLLTAPIWKV